VRRKTPVITLVGTAEAAGDLLRAPASGTACVHWRLRITEQLAPGLELVHQVVSPEPMDVACRPDPSRPAICVRVAPDSARLEAVPVLFRQGSPGALAVASQFGLRGMVRVEEVVIRHGDALQADGVLVDPGAALSRGPFRGIDAPAELLQPTLRMKAGLSLRPVILPWALGTAAALLGTMSVGAWLLHLWEGQSRKPAALRLPVPAEVGAGRPMRHHWP